MSIRIAIPLPECALCERPTRRATLDANGGLCSACATGVADTVRMLPIRGAVSDLETARRLRDQRGDEDAQTVFVERYIPPVPGQLTLPAAAELLEGAGYDPLDGDEGQW